MGRFAEYLKEAERKAIEIRTIQPHSDTRGGGFYHAYIGKRRVGGMGTWRGSISDKYEVHNVVVHKSFRKRGVATALYKHAEADSGQHLTPSTSLSDDGFKFWSKYRPEAIKHDLRHHRDKLMGKKVDHPKYGSGTIIGVGQHAVSVKRDGFKDGETNSVYGLGRDGVKHHLGKS